MVKIKGGEEPTTITDIVVTCLRYGILLFLLSLSLQYMQNTNIQFTMFIILLIVLILGSTFLIRDITNISNLKNILNSANIPSLTTDNSMFLYFFIGALTVGILAKVITLTFFLVVLDYGRKELKPTDTNMRKKMSSHNTNIMNTYIKFFIISTMMIIALSIVIFISYSSETTRIIVKNISASLLSLGILGIIGYELFLSIMFLRIRQHKNILYEITTTSENINTIIR